MAGDVSSFDQNAFKEALATQMGVSPSAITLSVTSASVAVTATIVYPTQGAAQNAAITLAYTSTLTLSAALGVPVQAVANIAPTSVAVTTPSPAPPPYIPGVLLNADGTMSIIGNLLSGGGSGVSTGVVVGVAVGVPLFMICVVIIVCNFKRRQKQVSTPVRAIPTAATNIPVAQASAESGFEMEDYGHSSAFPAPDLSVGNDNHDSHIDKGQHQLSDYVHRKNDDNFTKVGDPFPMRHAGPCLDGDPFPITSRERASADFEQLVAMGFVASKVAAALSQNHGDPKKAMSMLLAAPSAITWSSTEESGHV